ncbi:hypothetical protein G8759_17025 [Spirosoma aureum]|uniref:Uncharacterized protein n=1 Tax=Spirosoma aureum TaxID=2692134 RepID=A0A6G9APD2_9BACT|nr:hypothetical protein [Spirosoma aureum]QIP14196.1 hypothetical protein G8759_17025 [Spirosoma aureum]
MTHFIEFITIQDIAVVINVAAITAIIPYRSGSQIFLTDDSYRVKQTPEQVKEGIGLVTGTAVHHFQPNED